MDPEQKRKQLEQNILDIIEEKLKKGQMDEQRAKAIARMVLEKLHPPLSLEQIYAIAPTLDDQFSELTMAILPIIKEHDDQLRTVVSAHAEKLIRMGNIDKAYEILRSATKKL